MAQIPPHQIKVLHWRLDKRLAHHRKWLPSGGHDVPELPSGCIWPNIFDHVRWPWCIRAAIWPYLTQYIHSYQVTMYQSSHLVVSDTIHSLISGDHVPELPSGCIWHNIFTHIRWPCTRAAIWVYLTQYIHSYQVTMYQSCHLGVSDTIYSLLSGDHVPELPSGCIWHNIFTHIRWPWCARAAIWLYLTQYIHSYQVTMYQSCHLATRPAIWLYLTQYIHSNQVTMYQSCHLAVSDTIHSLISGDHVPELPSGCIWHNTFNHIRWPWCTRAAIWLYLTQYINHVRWPWCTRAAIWLYLTQYIQPYQVTIMYQTCHLAVSGTIYSLISGDHDVPGLPSGCIWHNIFTHISWPWCTRAAIWLYLTQYIQPYQVTMMYQILRLCYTNTPTWLRLSDKLVNWFCNGA